MFPDPDTAGVTRRYADLLDTPAAADLAGVVAALDAHTARIAPPDVPPALTFTPRNEEMMRNTSVNEGPRPVPTSPVKRRGRRVFTEAATVAAVLLVAIFAALLFGPLGRSGLGPGPGQRGASTATPTVPPPASFDIGDGQLLPGAALANVQMVTADDGWAVGYKRVSLLELDALILHYTSGRWQEVRDPLPRGELSWVSMASADDGWAGGYLSGGPSGILLHYTRGHWTSVPVNDDIIAIQMVSEAEGWAISQHLDARDQSTSPGFHLLHYTGGAWSPTGSADTGVTALSMLSTTEGWAAGLQGVILHYRDGHWAPWKQRAPGDVLAITMVSPTDGWLTGVSPTVTRASQEYTTFMMHFDGQTWQPVVLGGIPPTTGSFSNGLGSIAMTSASDGWAVGSWSGLYGTIVHFAHGVWQPQREGTAVPLTSISMVSASEGWAVGAKVIVTNGDEAAVLVHYTHGSWIAYQP